MDNHGPPILRHSRHKAETNLDGSKCEKHPHGMEVEGATTHMTA